MRKLPVAPIVAALTTGTNVTENSHPDCDIWVTRKGNTMRKILRDLWCGIKIGLMIGLIFIAVSLGASWITINCIKGWRTYQVIDHRIKWAFVVRMPGREPFYNHYLNCIDSHWCMYAKYRISPWFDTGRSTTPIDNPVLDEQTFPRH